MLWLWLVSGLVEGCLCSGIYPPAAVAPPAISTSEAHGPLARLALQSYGGGFPRFSHQAAPYGVAGFQLAPHPSAVVLPVTSAAIVDHRLSKVAGYTSQPALTAFEVADPKHTTVKFQVKRPAIKKQFYEVEDRTVVRPIGSAVVELDGSIPNNLSPPLPAHRSASLYRPSYSYPVGSYPLVSYYYPFQAPFQAYPPAFFQQPQVIQIPQQTPVYPQQPVFAPRPPQQSPTYPQEPVYAPEPPQQTPAYPQPPQEPVAQPPQQYPVFRPPSSSTGSEEFDDSDTVVIDNPDFERSASSREQIKIPTENSDRNFQEKQKPCDEGKEAQRILEEFQNRQILRQFGIKQSQLIRGVEPSNIQTLQELEGLGRQLKTEGGFNNGAEKERSHGVTEKSSSSENQDFLRSPASDQEIIQPKLKTTSLTKGSTGQITFPGEDHNNRQRLFDLLTADEGVVRERLVSVTPVPVGEGLAEGVSSRNAVVHLHTLQRTDVQQPELQLTRLVRPTLATALIYHQ